jgi:hypothetical protein
LTSAAWRVTAKVVATATGIHERNSIKTSILAKMGQSRNRRNRFVFIVIVLFAGTAYYVAVIVDIILTSFLSWGKRGFQGSVAGYALYDETANLRYAHKGFSFTHLSRAFHKCASNPLCLFSSCGVKNQPSI